jgi:hypothetical protein
MRSRIRMANDHADDKPPHVRPVQPVRDEPNFLRKSERPRLSRAVQAQLGHRLRVYYEALKLGDQPIPDRFVELLERLDKSKRHEEHS